MAFGDLHIVNVDEHLKYLDAQIRSLELRAEALRDRRGMIVSEMAKAAKEREGN